MTTDLAWDDLRTLSVLAAEKADDPELPMRVRDRWADVAERIIGNTASAADLRAAAELAELDAALQPDARVRQRYLDVARRAVAAAR